MDFPDYIIPPPTASSELTIEFSETGAAWVRARLKDVADGSQGEIRAMGATIPVVFTRRNGVIEARQIDPPGHVVFAVSEE